MGAQSMAVRAYLTAYNVASAVAWAMLLMRMIEHLLINGTHSPASAFDDYGALTIWVQTAALLEVAHAALGLVRSGVVTTVMQVSSRIFILYFVCRPADLQKAQVPQSWAWITMVTAWSITEVVRYNFYALGLWNIRSNILLTCRYSFFYVLYPLGAGSEWVLLVRSIPVLYASHGAGGAWFHTALALYYPYGLFVMMSHMGRQRKKALYPNAKSKTAKSSKKEKAT